jgi:hypothetical protein
MQTAAQTSTKPVSGKKAVTAMKRRLHLAKNLLDAEVNRLNGLPPLQGSQPQILWAESIRREKLLEASNYAVKSGRNELVDAVIDMSKWNQAAHWISRRDDDKHVLLSEGLHFPKIGLKPQERNEASIRIIAFA